MATIDKDGIYRVGDKVTGSQMQFLKGTEIGDLDVEYVGPFPEPGAVKAESAPENKKAAAPENKKA